MKVCVFTQPSRVSKAGALVRKLGLKAQVFAFRQAPRAVEARDHCIFYLSGKEPPLLVEKSLKRLSSRRNWTGKLVLFSEYSEPDQAVEWGRLVERFLPKRSQVCFQPASVVTALRIQPNRLVIKSKDTKKSRAVDIPALRKELGLTQAEMAAAVGVTPRTLQNWELLGPSPQAARRLRDVIELHRALRDYIRHDAIHPWLTAPNEAFGGSAPRDLIIEGRTRDVLLEFRRLQTGEPF